MNITQAYEFIHSVSWLGSKPGLSRITELLNLMNNPQNRLKYIHVTGTNGKGSVCAMLASVFNKAGYRTGLYTSPYIEAFNERIRINGLAISDEKLCELVEYIKPLTEKMSDKPTEFEIITALAFEYFSIEKCDIVILEVGMGGEFDATNVIEKAELSVITSIALDHTKELGDSLEKIALTKSGIAKNGCPFLSGEPDDNLNSIIRASVSEHMCDFYTVDFNEVEACSFTLEGCILKKKNHKEIVSPLLGKFQLNNLLTVLKAIDILSAAGWNIGDDFIREGIKETAWKARFELISKVPPVILDGAHNPHAAISALDSIRTYFPGIKVDLITGMMKDKDYRKVAEILSPVIRYAYTVKPDNPRALDEKELLKVYNNYGCNGEAFSTIKDAASAAFDNYFKNEARVIVALGSLYMYAETKKAILKYIDNQDK